MALYRLSNKKTICYTHMMNNIYVKRAIAINSDDYFLTEKKILEAKFMQIIRSYEVKHENPVYSS